ncbi:MAG: radical SAM protein [Methanothrix sp.]|nr:radical SAM protein [Methanothrix sp.]
MLIVAWEVTAACNLSCGYCRASASPLPDPDELSTKEALSFLDSIAPLRPMLILSGGEPLLRPDIFQIASHGVALGMRVSLASNGTTLTPQVADEIAATGISRVSISLDGATAKKHDQSRGKGSFQAALQGIESLRGKVDFQINNTLTCKNEFDVSDIFDLAQREGACALHFFFLVATGRGREADLITPKRQEELLQEIDRERSQRPIDVQVTCAPQYARIAGPGKGRAGGCLAGKSFVFISRKGDVYPCGYFPLRVGTIREKNFIEIWENAPQLRALRERALKGKCGRCSFSGTCGGCRARAYAETGDFLGPDPACCLEV